LKLQYDGLLSRLAFNFNLRGYQLVIGAGCADEQPLSFVLIIPAGLAHDGDGVLDGVKRAWAPLMPYVRKEAALPAGAYTRSLFSST
jgi:hypothetical protein